MIRRRLSPGGVARLCMTLLALICMLARAVLPMPAMAHTPGSFTADAAALGASLCHSDEGGDDQSPAELPFCDHCPVCADAPHVVPILSQAGAIPKPASSGDALLPAGLDPHAPPRAPPDHSHVARAPPSF